MYIVDYCTDKKQYFFCNFSNACYSPVFEINKSAHICTLILNVYICIKGHFENTSYLNVKKVKGVFHLDT